MCELFAIRLKISAFFVKKSKRHISEKMRAFVKNNASDLIFSRFRR